MSATFAGAAKVRVGSRAAVAGTRIVQPVHHQLRKCLVRSGTHASCHYRTLGSPPDLVDSVDKQRLPTADHLTVAFPLSINEGDQFGYVPIHDCAWQA